MTPNPEERDALRNPGRAFTPAAVFSVDVEDYFQVEAFSDVVDRSAWDGFAPRVESSTRRLLDLADEGSVRGTFFVLGWIAERFPALVREIAARGHELACHSYWHRRVDTLEPAEFRDDTARAKRAIEDAASVRVDGYRAPSYSITRRSLWAFEVLAELGFAYDSSIFPIHHDTYGIPDAPRTPFRVATAAGEIVEFPIATFRLLGRTNFPCAGGGYLRLFPFWYTRLGVARAAREGVPVVAYVHPWEVDPGQPRIAGRLASRLRHYTNLTGNESKVRRLLALGPFTSFRDSAGARAHFPRIEAAALR